jgi:exodeoxyribonuclease VII large subunit
MRERIVGYVQQRMESEKNRLTRVSERIPILFSLVKERQEAKLDRMLNEIVCFSERSQLSQAQHHVAILKQ